MSLPYADVTARPHPGASRRRAVAAGLLYGVQTTDAAVYASVALLTAGVAFAASYLPPRRAARIDPAVTLRGE
jgi:hypothetical protein